jgi:hypothetical protein
MAIQPVYAHREVHFGYTNALGAPDTQSFHPGVINPIDTSIWEMLRKRKDSKGNSVIDQMIPSVLSPLNETHAAAVIEGKLAVPAPSMSIPQSSIAQQLAVASVQTVIPTGEEEAAIAAIKEPPPPVMPRAKNVR